MTSNKTYHTGLLYLVHLLICSDGTVDEVEKKALKKVKEKENIPDSVFDEFQNAVVSKKERDIYQEGIDMINQCSKEEKLKAFVHLYKMSEVDGRVHVKEVRLLLYSIKMAGIEFDDVVTQAAKLTTY
jgi:uncharacterized tellurite resistance protein B-like protein